MGGNYSIGDVDEYKLFITSKDHFETSYVYVKTDILTLILGVVTDMVGRSYPFLTSIPANQSKSDYIYSKLSRL